MSSSSLSAVITGNPTPPTSDLDELPDHARRLDEHRYEATLTIPSIRCGGCVHTIEKAMSGMDGVVQSRVNLTNRKLHVVWDSRQSTPALIDSLQALGFEAHFVDENTANKSGDILTSHLRALAVAGFATANIMLLSVSVWAGADPATRQLFHLLSAAIALPAIAYSGQIFFNSALNALRHGHTNMDVPVSVGIVLATAMSVYDTFTDGQQVYFEASIMLVFFLLIGRTLDCQMRARARDAADSLKQLEPGKARIALPDGEYKRRSVSCVQPGDRLQLLAGERVPVDCRVETGSSTVDRSLISGESIPIAVTTGSELSSGVLNLTSSLILIATSDAEHSFLSRIRRTIENAELHRGRYRHLADRAASLYSPVVHLTALLSVLAWMWMTGDLHQAITIGISVLIITCPCALGLAVPIVQMIATRRLYDQGMLMKDGAALERLAQVDTVVFDKTGTLTTGRASVYADDRHTVESELIAAHLAGFSQHPYALALSRELAKRLALSQQASLPKFDQLREIPGAGMEGRSGTDVYRLGRLDWATPAVAIPATSTAADSSARQSQSVLSINGKELACFSFTDEVRADVRDCVDELRELQFSIEILSGDERRPVQQVAQQIGIENYQSLIQPIDKQEYVEQLQTEGHGVLMIGDGVNDSPALTAASVSMSPGSASDVSRNTADFIYLQDNLSIVPRTVSIARRALALIRQNMALAVLYNLLAIPAAVAGYVTPLIAALAMSLSSILVVANSMRLFPQITEAMNSGKRAPEESA